QDIINDVLKGNDVLVLMPTGGGKSLCYQYPSLLFKGLTLVVSPLISLMKDQVDRLRQNGIAAEYFNSSLNYEEKTKIKSALLQNKIRLLYVAPEGLTLSSFLSFLKGLKISLFAIDEAHCISEWGRDFRPEYRKLKIISTSFPDVPIIALTATATTKVREDIINQLELKNCKKYIASFNRKNLVYYVKSKQDAFRQIVEFLKNKPHESGIIYCYSKKNVDALTENLESAGFRALPYHADLSASIRSANQDKFIKDDVEILVATIAFGMGIDKPNIRFVIHFDLPKSIDDYYQQTGRAGRDGLRSECVLFYSDRDREKIEYFIDKNFIDKKTNEEENKIANNKLRDILNFCETANCRRKPLLDYFGEDYAENNCNGCDNCLKPAEEIKTNYESEIKKEIIKNIKTVDKEVSPEEKKLKEDINSYEGQLKINPKNWTALYNKGLAHYQLGNYNTALNCYDKALNINPKNKDILNSKGDVLDKLGRHEDAKNCYDKAYKISSAEMEMMV
ncbi:MAG: RecQ family ATP-dependent DNA helicase, partial [Candidatus Methanoperedens sp.]|nr:RecQ family ATP-dependent DNA helicase [Candidatus Methanoperedens sp.]